MLETLRIASPCSESWNAMEGDERVRFCGGCSKYVYNVAAMTTAEAQTLIAENEGELCMRLFRRRDGTVITSDCPVGVRRKQVTKIAAAALAFGGAALSLAALSPATAAHDRDDSRAPRVRRGQAASAVEEKMPTEPTQPRWYERLFEGEEEEEPEVLMGDVAPAEPVRMGKIAVPKPPAPSQPVQPDSVPKL
jgi:hypothetical protein